MLNSHYVPMSTLRRFGGRLCLFNVKTGEYQENINIKKIFSKKGFYSDEVEEKLNKRIESQFGNLFSNKLEKLDDKIELSREELRLVKKFLLISVIRSMGSENLLQKEKRYYEILNKLIFDKFSMKGFTNSEIESQLVAPPFEEKNIPNESEKDYWLRTLNVILDSDGTIESILNHPNKTYPAHRWAKVINNGYISIWDSEYDHEEFLITDIGMTSENEKGWNGTSIHNHKKNDFLYEILSNEKNETMQNRINYYIELCKCFSENFMMFPISAKRMIVEISPFYKFRAFFKNHYEMPILPTLTEIPNENLFYPNHNKYILPQKKLSTVYHPDDKYIYEIKKLTIKETRYCNQLFLDRINTLVGFSSLNKVAGSLFAYKKTNSYPYIPRADYTELYKIISNRYQSNININNIKGFRR